MGKKKLAPKKLKNNFFLIYVISFKGSCTLLHCFYILRNLKLVFTHFTFTNLPWCSQSMNSLMCILYTDPQLITDVITLLRTTATKKFSVLPPKPYACRNVCSWIVYGNQLYIRCYYLHLVLRWFNIANPFYFNLSEVFFNLDQERKLHAINCVLFFAKAFISSLKSEQYSWVPKSLWESGNFAKKNWVETLKKCHTILQNPQL